MTTDAAPARTYTIALDEESRSELLHLLEHALGETRVEVHHTHTPDFRDQVKHREEVLRGLIEKLQPTGA